MGIFSLPKTSIFAYAIGQCLIVYIVSTNVIAYGCESPKMHKFLKWGIEASI